MKKGILILTGIVLLVGTILTGKSELSKQNADIYKQAIELDKTENMGFENFHLADYPVAYYDGVKDYVLTYEEGQILIAERKPVLSTIAATAYPIDGHYEVLVPTVERMESLIGVLGTGMLEYKADEQVATLWHEAFHCYQFTHYKSNIDDIVNGQVNEKMISEYVDSSDILVELYTKQAELLQTAANTEDIDTIKKCLTEYKEIDNERNALLSKDVLDLEEYYTGIEGSAYYVEACVYRMLNPDEFQEKYIETIGTYSLGSSKYYTRGMAMCMILDILNPNWKEGYDYSIPLIEFIYNELEI